MKRTWSGVACARHCKISARNWCCGYKAEKRLRSATLKKATRHPRPLRCELGPRSTPGTLTFLTRSFSSICPRSLPAACAMRFPATRFPTITEAGPTPASEDKCQPSAEVNSSSRPTVHFQTNSSWFKQSFTLAWGAKQQTRHWAVETQTVEMLGKNETQQG